MCMRERNIYDEDGWWKYTHTNDHLLPSQRRAATARNERIAQT